MGEKTKTLKLTITYSKKNEIDSKEFFKELRDIQYKSFLAYNRVLTYLYTKDMQDLIQKDLGMEKEADKNIYGKSFQAWCENRMNEIIEGFNSANIAQARAFVFNRYKNDKKAGLLKGKVSLSQFRRNCPVILHNKSYRIAETDKGLAVETSFFNLKKQKEFKEKDINVKKILFNFAKMNKSEKAILLRIMNGTYKQGTAQFKYDDINKKWVMCINYTFKQEEKQLNENLILGVDLSLYKVATISIYDTSKNEYIYLSNRENEIDGAEIIHHRKMIEARRRQLSIASKYASNNNIGHGYKARMEKANKIADKYSRFKETYNHKISRYIVSLAVKYNVACVQMEDLTGFNQYQSDTLLKNWSYYDLQQKIKYKANEQGIIVNFINPQFTSQRCNKCGYINDKKVRDYKEDDINFVCPKCGHSEKVNINASKNIAIPNIESLIQQEIDTIDKK